MLLCPLYTETQNSQDATCSIYVLWKTWLKRKRKTAMLYFQRSCEVWGVGKNKLDRDRERRLGESDFLHPQILCWWWQGTGLSEPPYPYTPSLLLWCLSLLLYLPPSLLHPYWLEERVKCPPWGTDSKTVFTRSTLSPLLTACEELLLPPLMCQPNGEELAASHCIC